jgi:predicted molibdopterin-dependent oxidoreductase YjgC
MQNLIINENNIKDKIHTIRNLQVMLDRDLAELYEKKGTGTIFLNSYLRYVTINETIKDFYMTMKIDIKDQYLDKFEDFINSLPKDAVVVKKSLDDEINQRVDEYKSGTMKTVPFGTGLDKIRKKLESQI